MSTQGSDAGVGVNPVSLKGKATCYAFVAGAAAAQLKPARLACGRRRLRLVARFKTLLL